MKPGRAPSECPCELMPPPQLSPPVFLSTMFRVRSTCKSHQCSWCVGLTHVLSIAGLTVCLTSS